MTDIMVDLETLDTRQTATILSIGACRIDWTTGEIVDPFYVVVDSQSGLDIGLTESASTRQFWDKQGPEARKVFTDPNVPIQVALSDFGSYLRRFGIKSVELWGNGSDFDNTILTNAYDKCGLRAPWMFYNNRCFRTLRKTVGRNVIEPVREGTHHNALDDAIYQAKILLGLKDLIGR